MKNVFLVTIFLFTTVAFSQVKGSIKGTVTDKITNNEPLLFANVHLKGSKTSSETNFHGNYEIPNIKPGSYTLIITYAGYVTEEIIVVVVENEVTEIETNLSPLQINFDDIIGMEDTSLNNYSSTATLPNSSKK